MAEGNAESCKMAMWCLWQRCWCTGVQCTSCQKWVHKKCSGIKGSMYKVMKTFICRVCMNLWSQYEFCYFCDMLSVDGDADAAVENRIRIGWDKFRQLVPLLFWL